MKPYDETQFQNGMNMPPIPPQQGEEFISDEEVLQAQEKKDSGWQYVAVGGTVGLLMGVGAAYAATHLGNEEVPEGEEVPPVSDIDGVEPNPPHPAHHVHHVHHHRPATIEPSLQGDMRVAEVSDSWSFNEAFASAREQVGAGGVFEWRGGLYGTYYANEWNAMSQEERDLYEARVQASGAYGGGFNGTVDEQTGELRGAVFGETHDWEIGDYNGNYTDMRVNGHEGYVWDINGDGTQDVAWIDRNDNSDVDDNEWYDLRTRERISEDELDRRIEGGTYDLAEKEIIEKDLQLMEQGGSDVAITELDDNDDITDDYPADPDDDVTDSQPDSINPFDDNNVIVYTSNEEAVASEDNEVSVSTEQDYMAESDYSGEDSAESTGADDTPTDDFDPNYTEPPVEDPMPDYSADPTLSVEV